MPVSKGQGGGDLVSGGCRPDPDDPVAGGDEYALIDGGVALSGIRTTPSTVSGLLQSWMLPLAVASAAGWHPIPPVVPQGGLVSMTRQISP